MAIGANFPQLGSGGVHVGVVAASVRLAPRRAFRADARAPAPPGPPWGIALVETSAALVEAANHRGGVVFINPGRLRAAAGYY